MKLNKNFEPDDRLAFDEKYTMENDPETYFENIDFFNKNIHSFNRFPKIISSEYVELSSNFLSDLRGFPKFESDEIAKKCSLKLSNNPITSLEGSPAYIYGFNISDCSKLANLKHCPEISGYININGCKSLKDLSGLSKKLGGCETSPIKISIIANRSGLESFKGCPKEIENFIVIRCDNLRSFDEFPGKVARLDITIFRQSLLKLHELLHETKSVGIVNLFSDDKGHEEMVELSCRLRETSDPFDFQGWCIEHDFEEYL